MAKRTMQPSRAGHDWRAPAVDLLAELPADRDGLLAAAVAAVVEIDAAVMRGDGAVVPGEVPLWGQRGQFLAVTGGMRALVEYEACYGRALNAHIQFHAVDLDGPLISATVIARTSTRRGAA